MHAASKGEERKLQDTKDTYIIFACTAIHTYIHIFHNLFFFKNTRLYTCFLFFECMLFPQNIEKAHVYKTDPFFAFRVPFFFQSKQGSTGVSWNDLNQNSREDSARNAACRNANQLDEIIHEFVDIQFWAVHNEPPGFW